MLFAKYLPGMYQGADHTGRRVFNFGGGSGGGGHTTSTVTQTSIPEWLRPQTEAVLGAGMQEYFNATPRTTTNPLTGQTTTEYDITGTKPYTPYSRNPRDYVAEFSPQQQRVFGEAAGMQTPGGFQTGQQMTGMAGMGGLETVGGAYGYGAQGAGYGGQGSMFGQQAAGMGGMYEQMATDPRSIQAYMSPYMQNVVEIQKQQAIEDAQRAQLGANLGAARHMVLMVELGRLLLKLNERLGLINSFLIFKLRDFNQRLIKPGYHNSLELRLGFKGFRLVFRVLKLVFKALAWGLRESVLLVLVTALLARWALRQQILVRHNNRLIFSGLDSSVRLVVNSKPVNNKLLIRPFKTTHSPKRCRFKGWLATTHFFVAIQHLRQRPSSIKLVLILPLSLPALVH
jgi:hypothetical protein